METSITSQATGNPIVAKTPLETLDTTANANNTAPNKLVNAPAVISAKPAAEQATQIQNTMNTASQGAVGMSAAKQNTGITYDAQDNMVITGGTKPDGSLYVNTIPKGTAGYIPNPKTVQVPPPKPETTPENPGAYSKPSLVTPPVGINVNNLQGQAEWYNQNPADFETWAKDQKMNDTQVRQVQATAYNAKLDTAYNDYSNKINQIANGTYPLTADQTAQLNALQASWESTISAQRMANETYSNAYGMASARRGGEYDPLGAAGDAQRAMAVGINAIRSLQAAQTEAIANMRQGFFDKDYKAVTDANKAYLDHEKAISDNLKTMYDENVAAQEKADAKVEQDKQDAAKKILDDHTMSLQDKKQALDELQLSETERHNKEEELIAQETAAKGTYQIKDNPDGTQSIFNTKTGKVEGSPSNSIVNGQMSVPFSNGSYAPNNTGIPLIDQNMKQTSNGVWYIDSSNLTKAQQESISMQAAKLGIPYMGSKQANVLNKISDVKNNIAAIKRSLDSLPSNWFTRLAVGPLNNLAAATQSNPELASFNSWRTSAIQVLQALAGGEGSGLRINQAEIQMSLKNDIPNIDDTVPTAAAKVAKIQAMLDNQEKSLFGPNYDIQKAQGSSHNSTEALKKIGGLDPKYAKQIQAIHANYPNYSDDEILQIFNPNAQ